MPEKIAIVTPTPPVLPQDPTSPQQDCKHSISAKCSKETQGYSTQGKGFVVDKADGNNRLFMLSSKGLF